MTNTKNINFENFLVPGVRLGIARAGIKKKDRRDLVLIEIAENSNTAAVFTKNAFCAAPIIISKKHLAAKQPRFLLINTGNANAGTGERGIKDAMSCCQMVADVTKIAIEEVLPFSTGVIGEYLPLDKFPEGIKLAFDDLSENNWENAAYGIMTTDTVVKAFTKSLNINGQTITISGIAKGSGMIRPDMATMLAYIATDAKIEQKLLDDCLLEAVNYSFNRITVDGDTSTNDSAVLIATGQSGIELTKNSAELDEFKTALTEICEGLAKEMVRDGEGATKLITINVTGSKDEKEAKDVAFTVAHSPLVKTAFFASDPNWGRILAAVGRSGIQNFDLSKVNISLDDVYIVRNGEKASDYTETKGQSVMSQVEISININLGRGTADVTVWTCDFSYDYVRINAEYRT